MFLDLFSGCGTLVVVLENVGLVSLSSSPPCQPLSQVNNIDDACP